MAWTQTVTVGELEAKRTVYAPWLPSVREILAECGLGWTKRLLIRDLDVDFSKSSVVLHLAALGDEPGADVLAITITLTPSKEE